jgi:hypothetical protein
VSTRQVVEAERQSNEKKMACIVFTHCLCAQCVCSSWRQFGGEIGTLVPKCVTAWDTQALTWLPATALVG